jgi:hypothetical protein
MIVRLRQHARDHAALVRHAQALVGAKLFDPVQRITLSTGVTKTLIQITGFAQAAVPPSR